MLRTASHGQDQSKGVPQQTATATGCWLTACASAVSLAGGTCANPSSVAARGCVSSLRALRAKFGSKLAGGRALARTPVLQRGIPISFTLYDAASWSSGFGTLFPSGHRLLDGLVIGGNCESSTQDLATLECQPRAQHGLYHAHHGNTALPGLLTGSPAWQAGGRTCTCRRARGRDNPPRC